MKDEGEEICKEPSCKGSRGFYIQYARTRINGNQSHNAQLSSRLYSKKPSACVVILRE